MISSFSVGLIGTSLKSIKLPFAINARNISKESAYTSNIVVFFFSIVFAIIFHSILSGISFNLILPTASLLFIVTYFTFELVSHFLNEKLRKNAHIIIGIILLFVGFRLIAMSIMR